MSQLRVLNDIRHNGKRYKAGDIIPEIDSESAERLIDLKVAEFTKTNTKTKNNNPEPAGGGVTPVQGNSNPDEKTAPTSGICSTLTEPHLRNNVSDGSVCSLSGLAPAPSERKSHFAEMTNTEQIQYLSSLSDEAFIKAYEELENYSKSKSKAHAVRRLKQLTKENKDTN